MCGIVGFIGRKPAAPLLLEGLAKLEYRGYDSAGIALVSEAGIEIHKAKGRLQILSDMIGGGEGMEAAVGIGHTRWATHGKPSDENSHPHRSASGRFAVVHNGIIENYAALKKQLMEEGVQFLSETDTEVVAHLIEKNYHRGFSGRRVRRHRPAGGFLRPGGAVQRASGGDDRGAQRQPPDRRLVAGGQFHRVGYPRPAGPYPPDSSIGGS